MPIIEQAKTSQLGLQGKTPPDALAELAASTKQTITDLATSQLDLNGKTPEKYLDNKPQ
jgi:hypothetical protein